MSHVQKELPNWSCVHASLSVQVGLIRTIALHKTIVTLTIGAHVDLVQMQS